ncbi:MFS transporter [Amycolatopsis sp. NPDC050768]|uniref:MFS transporter n=1 Tax=Amycolatopsis sp. NPDC050768 TaxID=3154839 RepID=UPI0033EBEBE1
MIETVPPRAPVSAPVPVSGADTRRRFHLVVVGAGVGFGLTAPFTALLVVGLGGSPSWAAFVVSSIGLSLLLVDFLGTRFVPRVSSRTALTVSLLVFGVGCLLSAATTSWEIVGLARVLQGFGTALFMGGGIALAVRLVGERVRGSAIGTFNAFWFLGVATGPLGGGLIAAVAPGPAGLRLLFGVCGVVNLAGAVAAWFLAPRWVSAVRPRLGLPAGLGVRGRRLWSVLVLTGLGQAVRSGLALTLVPLLGAQLGMGWVALGLALFALSVTDVAAMHFGGRFGDRHGRLLPLAAALAWGTVAVLALATVVRGPVAFAFGALAAGVTVGTTWVIPAAMTVDLAEDPDTALAAYRIACDIGMLAGGLLAGAGIAVGGVHTALAATAACLFGGLLLTLTVRETLPRRPHLSVVKEESVPLPSPEEFAVFAANSDITLTPERLAQAYATHTHYRADLERLRRLPLPFTEPVSEPATALAWITKGGTA